MRAQRVTPDTVHHASSREDVSGVRLKEPSPLPEWEIDEDEVTAEWRSPLRAPVLRAGIKVDGKYELVRKIGQGGMGSVWEALASDGGDDCQVVAIKILSLEALKDKSTTERFKREAALASQLRGTSFPAVHAWGDHHGMPYLAMEMLEGEDLFERLERRGALGVWETLSLLRPLGRALDVLSRAGAVHRDVKPRNIFFAKDAAAERVVLLDFGLAKPLGAAKVTKTGVLVGTPHYMSPEQLQGRADWRSDLWGLAAVAYRALTGQRPFEGNLEKALRGIFSGSAPPASFFADVPPEIDQFFARAFQKRPEARYQSGAEMVHAFESALLTYVPSNVFGASNDCEELTYSDIAWKRSQR
jgi:eukaryotic-like serine/threonine-protein kinase